MSPGIGGGGRGAAVATDEHEGNRFPIDGLLEVEGGISNWSQIRPFFKESVTSESKASPCCELGVICGEQAVVAKGFPFDCSSGFGSFSIKSFLKGLFSANPGFSECSEFVRVSLSVDSQETRFFSSISAYG